MFSPVPVKCACWNVGGVGGGDKLGVLEMFPDLTWAGKALKSFTRRERVAMFGMCNIDLSASIVPLFIADGSHIALHISSWLDGCYFMFGLGELKNHTFCWGACH